MRWIIVSKKTGQPVGPKTSFPTKSLAEAHCGPNEEPKGRIVMGPTSPFADELKEPNPFADESDEKCGIGYMQGRGAS